MIYYDIRFPVFSAMYTGDTNRALEFIDVTMLTCRASVGRSWLWNPELALGTRPGG